MRAPSVADLAAVLLGAEVHALVADPGLPEQVGPDLRALVVARDAALGVADEAS
jgi:hypothetical protein